MPVAAPETDVEQQVGTELAAEPSVAGTDPEPAAEPSVEPVAETDAQPEAEPVEAAPVPVNPDASATPGVPEPDVVASAEPETNAEAPPGLQAAVAEKPRDTDGTADQATSEPAPAPAPAPEPEPEPDAEAGSEQQPNAVAANVPEAVGADVAPSADEAEPAPAPNMETARAARTSADDLVDGAKAQLREWLDTK